MPPPLLLNSAALSHELNMGEVCRCTRLGNDIKCVAHRQGEEGDNFYVIGEGTFEARILQPDGEEKTVFTYEGKGAFGELALMYNCPRAATVLVQEAL